MSYCKLFKIIIVGDKFVGKTSILNKWIDPCRNIQMYQNTIGVEFGSKIYSIKTYHKNNNRLNIDEKKIKIHFWDTAGQEQFHSIIKSYFRCIGGIIIVFDLSDKKSFANIDMWYNEIKINNNCDDSHKHPLLILGNKSDMKKNISNEEIYEKVESLDAIYFEVSAMNNKNLEKAIHKYIDELYNNAIEIDTNGQTCLGIKNGVNEFLKNNRYKKRDNYCYYENSCCNLL